jgi:hypothetical protein
LAALAIGAATGSAKVGKREKRSRSSSPAAMTRGGSRNPTGGGAWGGRRSREQAGYIQLDLAKLLVAAASSGGTPCRRFENDPAASSTLRWAARGWKARRRQLGHCRRGGGASIGHGALGWLGVHGTDADTSRKMIFCDLFLVTLDNLVME